MRLFHALISAIIWFGGLTSLCTWLLTFNNPGAPIPGLGYALTTITVVWSIIAAVHTVAGD